MASHSVTNGAWQHQDSADRSITNRQSMSGRQDQLNTTDAHYLNTTQQDLLLAALNSQAGQRNDTSNSAIRQRTHSNPAGTMNGVSGDGLFMSPQQAELDNFNADYTPDLDYLDGDNFDFENADLGGEMIGALPGGNAEQHEKRKITDENDDEEEGDAKRQETQEGEKSAKKPGRKPLTSEPTTVSPAPFDLQLQLTDTVRQKRKAQNRAAQRAFRERKEAHLKDLETKVSELTKTREADKHENGMLKAQVDRLQIELREYRKRLSLNGGSGGNRSPPASGYSGVNRSNSNSSNQGNGGFQFDFPKFGALPGSQIFGNQGFNNSNGSLGHRGSITPPITQSPNSGSFSGPSNPQNAQSRSNSINRSMSPRTATGSNGASPASQAGNVDPAFTTFSTSNNMHGFASTLPQMNNTGNDPFGDLFSPSILKGAGIDASGNYFPNGTTTNSPSNMNDLNGGESTAGLNRVFQFNSTGSTSDSASPSNSSGSQWNANANSSCGTSPEPSYDSPANKSKGNDTFNDNKAVITDPSPLFNDPQLGNLNAYNVPSLDSFDPVLFGDYRDTNDAILGGGDFTGGFFDENLNTAPFDMASPSNLFGILQSPQQMNSSLPVPNNNNTGAANAPTPSKNLMAEMDKVCGGGDDDYGLPTATTRTESGKLISCNNIWYITPPPTPKSS